MTSAGYPQFTELSRRDAIVCERGHKSAVVGGDIHIGSGAEGFGNLGFAETLDPAADFFLWTSEFANGSSRTNKVTDVPSLIVCTARPGLRTE